VHLVGFTIEICIRIPSGILTYRTIFRAVDASHFVVFILSCIIFRTLLLYLSIYSFLLSCSPTTCLKILILPRLCQTSFITHSHSSLTHSHFMCLIVLRSRNLNKQSWRLLVTNWVVNLWIMFYIKTIAFSFCCRWVPHHNRRPSVPVTLSVVTYNKRIWFDRQLAC